MESAPPSYQTATSSDVWSLVAPYLTSNELCNASVVSRGWHRIFTAQLWSRPTSYFGLEYNDVLDHLARFQRTLDFARQEVRSFTFCLHLLPHEAVYFDDRPADWLKRLIELLPNLQALIVTGVSFFDHAACQVLRVSDHAYSTSSKEGARAEPSDSGHRVPRPISTSTSYGLRLLDASRCSNLTSTSLAAALTRFVSLLYLDLSYTRAARSSAVFEACQHLYTLKLLKLRAVQLKDGDLSQLSAVMGRRLCYLDVRDNELTTKAADLLQDCFADEPDESNLDMLEDEQLDRRIYAAYQRDAVNHLTVEDISDGLAQLHISGNELDEIALSKLLHRPSLRVLDIGRLSRLSSSSLLRAHMLRSRLTYLRVDHHMVMPMDAQPRLRPGSWPGIRKLVLTDVPTHSTNDQLANALIAFVHACADEAAKAMNLAQQDYAIPLDRSQTSAIQQSTRSIFALESIVLEMSPAPSDLQSRNSSLTEDQDSEALWSAGESDFSFFRDGQVSPNEHIAISLKRTKAHVDNLALLSAFRSQRKAAYDRAVPGDQLHSVDGYWPGIIRIERPD
ncbi:hypothetical protein AMS68_001123 [Peltaster fructicola]|uniref:F-box domain-containing protein n=1 Tax=Peltaster fructicola TaxID=286661 RepID=A0A6H0XLM7_9PEZI|nr:hypothetical protein AMS68_001123 [Peltaster fructicola]